MNTQGLLHTPIASSPPVRATSPLWQPVPDTRAVTRGRLQLAFTLAEVLVAIFVGAVFLTALYGAFTFGFGSVKASREDLRATQVLVQQMETLRLLPFNSIQSYTTNIYYDTIDQTNGGGGAYYTITITPNTPAQSDLAPPNMPAVVYYTDSMRLITATATWTNGNVPQSRSLKTYATKNGLQAYVYSPQ